MLSFFDMICLHILFMCFISMNIDLICIKTKYKQHYILCMDMFRCRGFLPRRNEKAKLYFASRFNEFVSDVTLHLFFWSLFPQVDSLLFIYLCSIMHINNLAFYSVCVTHCVLILYIFMFSSGGRRDWQTSSTTYFRRMHGQILLCSVWMWICTDTTSCY